MSNWDRPPDGASTNSAIDANSYAASSYMPSDPPPPSYDINVDTISSSATSFRPLVFEPPPSFDVDSATIVKASYPEFNRAPAAIVKFHYPGAPEEMELATLDPIPESAAGHQATSVRSIVAFARSSTPHRIARFEFQLSSGESLFAPLHVEDSGDLRPAGRWELLDGESLACVHVLTNLRAAGPTAWIFETSAQRMSMVFGRTLNNLSVRAFECGHQRASVGVEILYLSGGSDSSGALPPISNVSTADVDKKNLTPSSLLSVDIETGPTGVNKIAFEHLPARSSANESYGLHANGSSVESLHLQDVGTADAEFVAEVICVQDVYRLHAFQIVSSRGRRSEWILRGEWKAFRSSGKLVRMVDDMGDELEREASALPLSDTPGGKPNEKPSKDSDSDSYGDMARSRTVLEDLEPEYQYEGNEVHTGAPKPLFDCDIDCDSICTDSCFVGCFGYISGMVIIALFAYGCAATAYMYSYSTTLGIWLGVFLPCAALFGFFGFVIKEDGGSIAPALCAGIWVVGRGAK